MEMETIDYKAESGAFKARVEVLVDKRASFKIVHVHILGEVAGILVDVLKDRGVPYEIDERSKLMPLLRRNKEDRYVIDSKDSLDVFGIRSGFVTVRWVSEKAGEEEEREVRIRAEEKRQVEKMEGERKLNEVLASMTPAQYLIYESIQALSTQIGELEDKIDSLESEIDELRVRSDG